MRILIDTNVILDILQKREPFFADSYRALRKAIEGDAECLISASAATDIFYMLRKALGSAQQAKEQIEQLAQLVSFADVQGMDIHTALMRAMSDFEDAVVDAVGEEGEGLAGYRLEAEEYTRVRRFSGRRLYEMRALQGLDMR